MAYLTAVGRCRCAVAECYLPHASTFVAGSVHYDFTVGGGYCDGCGSEVGCASFLGELGEGEDGVAEARSDVCLDGADGGYRQLALLRGWHVRAVWQLYCGGC